MKLFKKIIILVILFVVVLMAWLANYAQTSLHLPAEAREINIKPNSGLKSIAHQLVEQHVIPQALPFVLLTKLLRKEADLQAGNYTLNQNITPYQLILSLNNGKSTQGSITFIEGKTFKQMRHKLQYNQNIQSTILNMTDTEVMRVIGQSDKPPEGMFFPDTYYFDRNTADRVILKRAYEMMQTKLEQAWAVRDDNLPYKNSYEALIMASIIEKETGQAGERKLIAGVFINRLRIGMRLQTDPSVIYGMGEAYHGNIRRKDLEKDTPYNTYTRSGLPPTPIAMPGLAAIEAALHPAQTKALYFVGKGDGSHVFSNSLAEHNRAVVKYQLKK